MFGQADTFYDYTCLGTGTPTGCLVPVLTSDPVNNSLHFYYGDFDGPTEGTYIVDLLFTVTVNDDPFADRLQLTNQVHCLRGQHQRRHRSWRRHHPARLTEPVLLRQKP